MAAPQSGKELRRIVQGVSPDPFRDDVTVPQVWGWVYAADQYELAVLHRLVDEGFAANRHVDYAANFGALASPVFFRRRLSGSAAELSILATGRLHLELDGQVVPVARDTTGQARVTIPVGGQWLSVGVTAVAGPSAFAVQPDESAFAPGSVWAARAPGGRTVNAQLRWGTDRPPHELGEPVQTFTLPRTPSGLVDLGAPMLARIAVPASDRPRFGSGESMAEALADPAAAETRHDATQQSDGSWATQHQLGLRYLRVDGVEDGGMVTVEAAVRPAPRRGAFACSDETLTRIWATSAYTLRMCMQGLMIDGIKRDRMPWAGDQALSTLCNAYTFADGAIVRDSLTALGRPRHGYLNGISDYSLWWLINHGLYQRYFGDTEYLRSQAPEIDGFVRQLAVHAASDGVFRPPTDPDGFAPAPGSVFIDWGVSVAPGKDYTALQMLWFWALNSAGELLAAAGNPEAHRWTDLAERVRQSLHASAWDAATGAWREYLEPSSTSCAYPNFLAVLSGITESTAVAPGMRTALETGRSARRSCRPSRSGRWPPPASMLPWSIGSGASGAACSTRVRRPSGRSSARLGESPYAMYGRPFGKSLCHAWASGPAMLLPETVLGLRPIANGWTEFEVGPHLGDLTWAGAVVPTPAGEICVIADREGVSVDIPKGSTLIRDHRSYPGPDHVSW